MKYKHLLAFLAVALAIGCGSAAMISTYANDPETAESCNADALSAVVEKLAAGTQEIVLDGTICPTSNLTINKDLVLDLNGHDIISETTNARVLDIREGNVTIKGSGSIIAQKADGAAVRVFGSTNPDLTDFTNVTIEDGVKLIGGTDSYGLFVSYSGQDYQAYGVTINLESGSTILAGNGLAVNGMIQHENGPTFNIADGAIVTATGDGTVIYSAGYSTWNIGKAQLMGGTIIGIKSGIVNLKNTTMRATGTQTDNDPSSNGLNPNGAVIQIEENDDYAGGIDITIDGGTYSSDQNSVFVAYDANALNRAINDDFVLKIKGGTFTSADGKEVFDGNFTAANTQITGGTFTSDIKAFLPEGLTQDQSGKVISSAATVTPTDPDDDDQKADDPKPTVPDSTGKTPDTGVNRASEVSAVVTVGGLGVGVALVAIFALIAAIRHPKNGILSVEVTRTPAKASKRKSATTSTSKRKTASTASKKATSVKAQATVRTTGSRTRKTTKTASKGAKKAKKA